MTSAFAGDPRGGNADSVMPCSVGDVTVDEVTDPQFEQNPGLPGEDASDREEGDITLG